MEIIGTIYIPRDREEIGIHRLESSDGPCKENNLGSSRLSWPGPIYFRSQDTALREDRPWVERDKKKTENFLFFF